ncbi:MAG TPA: hypothetical protein VMH86_01110 [Rhizomicrobium sp.]|nr:hypothetical protein [Rhizomicrobium sp.]
MSFAEIQARAQSRVGRDDPARRAKYFRAAEQARTLANLKAEGFVVPLSEWLGHNNGPPWDLETLFLEYCWRKAHEEAWRGPTPEIAVRRARKAAELGLSYRDYTLEILERSRYPDEVLAREMKARTLQ